MAIKPISVTQFNSYVKRVLQSDPLLGNVSIIGEISNLKYHGSGHVFFTLKDESSKLSCFLPADAVRKLRYELTEGMLITAAGYISVYERAGTYSLNVRDIDIEGTGDLAMAFEALKVKLEKEGLFDAKYKKVIPAFPRQVAIVTSATGAAVRDMIKIMRSKNDVVEIIVFPCLVQGPNAALDILDAIETVNKSFPKIDLIIIGRGGGSIEELWAFNEEPLIRGIFLSEIPVISAVGHETDFTLSDYVADKRAATPTEAAQLAVPDTKVLGNAVDTWALELFNKIDHLIKMMELKTEQYNIEGLKAQLRGRLEISKMKAENLAKEAFNIAERKVVDIAKEVDILLLELKAASPYTIINRGYNVILDKDGRAVTSIKMLAPGDLLTVIHKDGKIICSVNEIMEESYGEERH